MVKKPSNYFYGARRKTYSLLLRFQVYLLQQKAQRRYDVLVVYDPYEYEYFKGKRLNPDGNVVNGVVSPVPRLFSG